MAFSDEVMAQSFRRSGGQCECGRATDVHLGRCPRMLTATSGRYHHVTSVEAGVVTRSAIVRSYAYLVIKPRLDCGHGTQGACCRDRVLLPRTGGCIHSQASGERSATRASPTTFDEILGSTGPSTGRIGTADLQEGLPDGLRIDSELQPD
jgi:hypothetical protein